MSDERVKEYNVVGIWKSGPAPKNGDYILAYFPLKSDPSNLAEADGPFLVCWNRYRGWCSINEGEDLHNIYASVGDDMDPIRWAEINSPAGGE